MGGKERRSFLPPWAGVGDWYSPYGGGLGADYKMGVDEGLLISRVVSSGMGRCSARNSKGEPCRRGAGDKAYCPFHLKKYQGGVTHGLRSSRKTLGIPEAYHEIYQEFLESDTPTDLRRELAQQRTLFVELRDALLSGDKREECAVKLVGFVKQQLEDDVPPGLLETYSVSLVEGMVDILKPYMPLTTMNLETAESLSKHLTQAARIAAQMKRIQEGMVLKVEMDQQVVVRILQQVIFPVIVDEDQRRAIAERASQFALRRTMQQTLPSEAISKAEATPDILDHL